MSAVGIQEVRQTVFVQNAIWVRDKLIERLKSIWDAAKRFFCAIFQMPDCSYYRSLLAEERTLMLQRRAQHKKTNG